MRPRLVITGASGFIGRHLLDALKDEYEIVALARRFPSSDGRPPPASVRCYQVDLAEAQHLDEVVADIRRAGAWDVLIHLAGHYDFTGERHPEYQRTNVQGTRHVLDAARRLGVRHFVFASSVAACRFPRPGVALDEASAPDGDTPYAESKRAGEQMLAECRDAFRVWIVRLAALFSDWGEYEPLFRFMETWLARRPHSRVLAGHGLSAVPYLHVGDAVAFFRTLLARCDGLDAGEVLLASPDGATSHLELFEAATATHFGLRSRPLLVPRPLCRGGLWLRDLGRRSLRLEAFERPWMGRFIDLQLSVDARRTRERLGWSPRPRLGVVRRMPFLVQNRKAFPAEWQRRNHAALKSVRLHENLRIGRLLEARIVSLRETLADHVLDPGRARRFPRFQALARRQYQAESEALLKTLVDAVRTGEKGLFMNACRSLAGQRRAEGFSVAELVAALDALGDLCVLSLAGDGQSPSWSLSLYDHVTMTVQFGIDAVHEVFEEGP